MGNIVNGLGTSRIEIRHKITNQLKRSIDLPLTDSEGLVESYDEVFTRHNLLNTNIEDGDFKGWRISFTLSYSEYANKELLFKIADILEDRHLGYKLILIPRIDVLSRRFEVVYSGDKIDLGLLKGGNLFCDGHRLPVISFTTKRAVPMRFYDPDNLTVPVDFIMIGVILEGVIVEEP